MNTNEVIEEFFGILVSNRLFEKDKKIISINLLNEQINHTDLLIKKIQSKDSLLKQIKYGNYEEYNEISKILGMYLYNLQGVTNIRSYKKLLYLFINKELELFSKLENNIEKSEYVSYFRVIEEKFRLLGTITFSKNTEQSRHLENYFDKSLHYFDLIKEKSEFLKTKQELGYYNNFLKLYEEIQKNLVNVRKKLKTPRIIPKNIENIISNDYIEKTLRII